jgi:DNA excision repair protein ERCC-4
MVVFDHRERRSGIPEALARLGVPLERTDLGVVDYVLSQRLAVLRKSERDLADWQALGRFHEAVVRAREQFPLLVLLLVRDPGSTELPGVRRGAIARAVRRGVSVLEADDADDAARWIARLADQEQRHDQNGRMASRRKPSDPRRLAEMVVAGLPGVGPVGARRLLEHFGSLRAVMSATADEIDDVPGFGRARAEAIAAVTAHRYHEPTPA